MPVVHKVYPANVYWKKIIFKGLETDYSVGMNGEVYCHRTKSMVSQFVCSSGHYKAVHLFINGIDYKCMVHRLVATAFIPNPENKPQVNHINAKTFNNHYTNLEWVTAKENIQHMIKLGHQVVGIDHPNAKFTEDQIHHVCRLLENPEAILQEVSRVTGVSIKTVKNIKHGVGWKHISDAYNIIYETRPQGPRFSPVSLYIHAMILNGFSKDEIITNIKMSEFGPYISVKSIKYRIYHINKLIENDKLA